MLHTTPICPVCRLPIDGGQERDPFDDYCECGPEDAACWLCGSIDHDDVDCPTLDDRAPVAEVDPNGLDDPAWDDEADGIVVAGDWPPSSPIVAADPRPRHTLPKVPQPYVRIAVYGTLRFGHGNHAHYIGADVAPAATGHIDGSLFYVRGSGGGFPVCVLGTGERTFVEVYDVTPDEFAAIARMECGAGYEVQSVDVTWLGGTGDQRLPALVFGWPYHGRHGDPVPGNDWSNA